MAKPNSKSDDAYAKVLGQIEACRARGGVHLNLNGFRLSMLPPEIGQLTALTSLHVDYNQLSTLPPEIGQLTALKRLDLMNNQLSTLPPEIGQLAALTTLRLNNNQLRTLPPEIGRLVRLERLILENNMLKILPESLNDLRSLKQLTLHGNVGLSLHTELLGPKLAESTDLNPSADPRAILDFYFSRQAEGEEPMREVRLLLVGRGRVGKTSLLYVLRAAPTEKDEPARPRKKAVTRREEKVSA